jgi:hypothetical protein
MSVLGIKRPCFTRLFVGLEGLEESWPPICSDCTRIVLDPHSVTRFCRLVDASRAVSVHLDDHAMQRGG